MQRPLALFLVVAATVAAVCVGVLRSEIRVAHAAAIASTASGNWGDTGTWVGGVVPGAGDDVTIAAGHTVTVPAAFTAQATTLAVAATGAVTNNGTLTVSGAISGDGSITQGANGVLNAGAAVTVTTLTATANPNTVNYTGAAQTVVATTYHHLGTSGSGAKTLAGATTLNGNLTVGAGTTLAVPGVDLTVSGSTSVTGTLSFITATTGTKTFTGDVAVNNSAAWTNSINEDVGLGGNLSINIGSTFTSGSGTYTMSGASKTITVTGGSGTTPLITNLEITGTVTNTGTEISVTNLSGAGTLTNQGSLRIGGTSTITGLVATASGNNISYDGGAQTVKAVTYHNLQLLSGAKTLTGVTTINGYLRLANGATATTAGNITIGAELCLAAAAAFTVAAGHTVSVGTGVEVGSATCGTPLTGTLTNNGTLTVTGSLSGSGSLINAANGTLNVGGSGGVSVLTATANPNTVNYTGAGPSVKGTTYHHLGLTGTGSTLAGNVTVNGTLSLTNGTVTTNANTLIVSAGGTVNRTTGHVVGNLRKNVATGATTRTFEVGTAGVYAPVTVAFGNVTVAGNLTAITTGGDHTSLAASGLDPARSVNRSWTLTNDGTSFDSYSATFTFVAGDLDGATNTSAVVVGRYDGTSWSFPTVGTRTATTTQMTGGTAFGGFVIAQMAESVPPEEVAPPPAAAVPPVALPARPPTEPGFSVPLPVENMQSKTVSDTATTTVGASANSGPTVTVAVPPLALPSGATVQAAAVADLTAVKETAPPPNRSTMIAAFQIGAFERGNVQTSAGQQFWTGTLGKPVEIEFSLSRYAQTVTEATASAVWAAQRYTLAYWSGTEWVRLQTTFSVEPTSSVAARAGAQIIMKAVVNHFTLFAMFEQPAEGTFDAPATYNAEGLALMVFEGGSADQLEAATRAEGARWAWTYDASGHFQLLVVGGPGFMKQAFAAAFPGGIPARKGVVLRR